MPNWIVQDAITGLYWELSVYSGVFNLVSSSGPSDGNPILKDVITELLYEVSVQDGVICWASTNSPITDEVYMFDVTDSQWWVIQIYSNIFSIASSNIPSPTPIVFGPGSSSSKQYPIPKRNAIFKRYYFDIDGKKSFNFFKFFRVVGCPSFVHVSTIGVTARSSTPIHRIIDINSSRLIVSNRVIPIIAQSRHLFNKKSTRVIGL